MKLLSVIPIARGISKETLEYFTTENVPVGSLVEVELRKKKIKGLVIGSEDALRAKAKIRSADFGLKKIEKLQARAFLSEAFVRATHQLAEYSAATTGAVLNAVIPKMAFKNLEVFSAAAPISSASPLTTTVSEKFVFQETDEHRLTSYRSRIRECFAKKQSIFILVPTEEDGLELKAKLEKGIENRVSLLTATTSKKKFLENWKKLNEKESRLIIGTGHFLLLTRADVKTIIVENERSAAYKAYGRPFLDYRVFAEFLAKEIKADFILADQYLRVETYGRLKGGDFIELSPLKFKSESSVNVSLIDMKKKGEERVQFKVLSPKLESIIKQLPDNKEKLFIFAARRGLSPTTICSDCGSIVSCKNCGAPVVLHKSKKTDKENFFLCHHCGEKRSALERCTICDSWKLTALGIGIEKIREEIEKKFPKIAIFQLDKETAPTAKAAREIVKKFYESPSGILIGTELTFLYHRKPVSHSAVVSMDSIFAIPDFRIDERVFHILTTIQNLTEKNFLIQTRNIDQPALQKFNQGNYAEFYREELTSRQKFGYPPFKVLIKISVEGVRPFVIKEMPKLEKLLVQHEPFFFPALVGTRGGKFVANALVKTERDKWPNKDLLQMLLSLPPNFSINVNPEGLI